LAGGGLVILLIILYFVATSAAFLKGVILPRVSKALNAEITVGDASISPFSQVVLRQLTVKTTGTEPLLQANEVRLRYSLWSIIGGKIKVDEITLDTPKIQIVQNADGTGNLDPLLKRGAAPAATPAAGPSKPLQLDVKNVTLKNVNLRAVQISKDGGRQTIELSDINIGLDQLKNGASGKLTLAAGMKMDRTATNAHDVLQAKGSGAIDFTLGPDLIPQIVRGKVTHEIVRGDGAFSSFAGERSELDCDLTPADVKNFSINFFKADKPLGALRITGPLDLQKLEGHLTLQVNSIDRQVLNLVGAARGWDFGNSTLNATNLIDITQKGTVIAANGKLAGRQFGIQQGNQSTPPLDLDFVYQVTVNVNDKTALLQRLDLAVKQGQNDLARTTLDRPMSLTWGTGQPGFKESSLRLTVNKLNLADWQLFLGNLPVSGKADAGLDLVAQQDGRQLKVDLTANLQELSAQFGSNKVERAGVQLQVGAQLTDFKRVTVDKYSLVVSQSAQSLVTATGSASYALDSGDLSAQATLDASLPGLLKVAAVPRFSASAGTIKLTALASRKGRETGASGNLVLSDLTGRYGDYQFQNFQTTADFDVGLKDQSAQIRRAAVTLKEGFDSGGSFDVTGKYDLGKNSGAFTFNVVDLNQNTFRLFLGPALAPNKLVSVSLNAKGTANYDAEGESSVQAELKLANLVVEDPQSKLPKTPLEAGVKLDGSMRQQLINLKQLLLTLTPTDRAKNELLLSGKLDFAKTNAAPAELTLRAESLDVTPYYDLFAGNTNTSTAQPSTRPAPAGAPAAPRTEPEPIALPLQQASFDAKIDRLYLRDIAVSNLVANAKINGSQVALKPFQLTLNGAPVSASVSADVGVPGWTYDLTASLDRVPVDPFVNSFMPASRDQYHGFILTSAQIKGAGITDASLQKNLSGQLSLSLTNATIQLVKGKPPKNVFGRLLWYTLEGIGTFLRVNEIASSPLNAISAQATIGDGKINLSHVGLQSSAFEAHTQGVIPMQVPLTNSPLNLPLEFSLSRSLAQKTGMMPANTPPDAAYAALPTFVVVKGTIGEPKSDYKELAIGGVLLKSGVGVAEKLGVNVGKDTGGLLKGVGNLLTGQKPAPADDTTKTNPPPPKFNPFNLLKKK